MGMFDQPQSIFADPSSFGAGDQVSGPLAQLLAEHLQNVMSGQVAAGGVLGQNYYDPSRSFAQNALDPRAIENATNIGMGLSTAPIRAVGGSVQGRYSRSMLNSIHRSDRLK
jgi:hypothetical protein